MSDRLISRLWNSANAVAARVYDALPPWAQESVANVANLVPDGPPRTADSGDFVEPPTFFDSSIVANLFKRYVGKPEQRARAWEEFAMILDRMGWRISDAAYEQAFAALAAAGKAPARRTEGETLFESKHFRVVIPRGILVDRRDGGHLIVFPLAVTDDIMSFTPGQTKEYTPFVMAVGRAFEEVMNESGIPVERINFMDLGNWNLLTPKKPHFHLHLFGRARGSRYQIHAEFNKLPPKGSKHFEMLAPLNAEEKAKLIERIPRYFAENMRAMEKPKAGNAGDGAGSGSRPRSRSVAKNGQGAVAKRASFSSVEVAKAATDGAPSVDALEQELVGAERAAGFSSESLVEDGFFVPGATPGVITTGTAARILPH